MKLPGQIIFKSLLLFLVLSYVECHQNCICEDQSLCKPVTKIHNQEVFVFSVSSKHWQLYDWDKITTIAEVGYHSPEMLCHAHSKGARVVALANFQPTSQLVNKTARTEWIESKLSLVRDNLLDGINVDFESAIYHNQTDIRAGLTALVQELSKALKTEFPHSQLSFDVMFRPLIHQAYDYGALAASCDLIFDMAYDMWWNVSFHKAHPNCDFTGIVYGIAQYEALGVPLKKLVLGVPWYGYIYPCVSYQTQTHSCTITRVPFRGVPCSDAAGKQHTYADIVENFLPKSFTGRMWDDQAKSPYFAFKDSKTEKTYQVWYDDPTSLKLKYDYATSKGLRGVGMWEADGLDYTETTTGQKQREAMWGALP